MEGVAPDVGPAGERAFWWPPCCPHTPALWGVVGVERGAGGGSAPPLSEITVVTCQALHPRDRARLIQATQDNGFQAHSEA